MKAGNPGLVEFYTPFLTAIHEKCLRRLCIFAHAHVGHATCLDKSYQDSAAIHLTSQVQATIEAVDAARTDYRKIILIGHSVGAWIVLQVCLPKLIVNDILSVLVLHIQSGFERAARYHRLCFLTLSYHHTHRENTQRTTTCGAYLVTYPARNPLICTTRRCLVGLWRTTPSTHILAFRRHAPYSLFWAQISVPRLARPTTRSIALSARLSKNSIRVLDYGSRRNGHDQGAGRPTPPTKQAYIAFVSRRSRFLGGRT